MLSQIVSLVDINELLAAILVLIVGFVSKIICNFIQRKMNEIIANQKNELAKKYLSEIEATLISCVKATNQTYVDALKKDNAFTADAQKEAFNQTLNAVTTILSDDCKEYIKEAYGDFNAYISTGIEATVSDNKSEG